MVCADGAAQKKQNPRLNSRNYQGEWPKTPARLLGIGLVRLYQLTLSGFIGQSCRHQPTCSEFAYEAIARYGLIAGSWLSLKRVARCNPWGTSGYDPVPQKMRWW
ncbi:MAG: membrane protein insertion efficiency factor YidD [Pseudomonadota bacterium]